MEKSNLLTILHSLDKKEVKELKKWLESPAHNQREDVQRLYHHLFSKRMLEKGKNLGKKAAFKSVFPEEETYDDAKMRQCMYFFLKALEDFLVFNELMEDKLQSKSILAKVFRKRRLAKVFEKNLRDARQAQNKTAIQNSNFHQTDYLLLKEKVRFYALSKRDQEVEYQELSDSLDIYFLADKLRQSTMMNSHEMVYKKSYSTGMLTKVLAYVEENRDLLDVPAIGTYYYALKCATEKEEANHFTQFKAQIDKNGHLFPVYEVRDLYLAAINHCINRVNSGQSEFLRELFELYRKGITQQILMEDGILSRFTFQNLVGSGTRLKEYEWVKKFIDEYESYLDEKNRESVVHYSRSFLNFEMGNYDEAMKLLNQVEYDDILLTLSGRMMLLRMFYELNYDDALDSLVSSTKAYIQRKKVIGYHKTGYSNLLKYIKQLSKLNPYDKDEKNSFLEKVQSDNPVVAKQWLIEQIQNL